MLASGRTLRLRSHSPPFREQRHSFLSQVYAMQARNIVGRYSLDSQMGDKLSLKVAGNFPLCMYASGFTSLLAVIA